jgi:hypothetical protein
LSSNRFESLKQALNEWEHRGFTLTGARKQGGYYETEAQHPRHHNLRSRGWSLEDALDGLERQIETQFGESE